MGYLDKYTGGGSGGGGVSTNFKVGGNVGSYYNSGGGWQGKAFKGDFGGAGQDLANNFGFDNRKQREGMQKYQQSQEAQRGETQGVLNKMNTAEDQYMAGRDTDVNNYKSNLNTSIQQAQHQATDARKVYNNTIAPEQKNIMENARSEAGNAMTLAQAGDVNNSVQQGVRGLYNKQGDIARQQGQQDFGVLSALGAQAAGNQFGAAGPMTAGMQGQIYAANQGQAGEAYARAQQQMNNLRQQGIESGFRESANQYDRGQGAKDRYSNSVKDIQNSNEVFQNRMGGFRNEIGGYNRENFGVGMGQKQDTLGIKQGRGNREMGMLNNYYGNQQAGIAGQIAGQNAGQAGKLGFLGQAVGTAAGAYMGGPSGAQAGGQMGSSAAGAASPSSPVPQPNYGPQGVSGAMNNGGGGYNYGNGYGYPARPYG